MITITIEGPRAFAQAKETLGNEFIRKVALLTGRKTWWSSRRVSFDASANNLKSIKEFSGIKWVDKTGELKMIEEMANFANQESKAKRAVSSWKPSLKLMSHQQKALNISWDREAYALLFEMGLGKTALLIANAGMLFAAGKIKGVLLVAPKGVDRQWLETEIPKHADPKFKVNSIPWKGKAFDRKSLKRDHLNFFAINVDSLRAKGGSAALKFIEELGGEVMMIVDESHRIKTHNALCTKAAIAIGSHCRYRRIATGSPIAKDVRDAFSQFQFLDERILGHRYITSFRNRYCIMGGFEGRQVIGHQRLEEFYQLIAPHSFRLTKAEALDLPPKVYVTREYDMSAEAKRHYTELKNLLLTQLKDGSVVSAANAAAKVVRLQQVVCGYLPREDGSLENIDNGRVSECMEVIEQVDGPVVIWCRFREDIVKVGTALSKARETFVEYHGGTKKKDRTEAVRAFLSGKARIFLATQAAGGTGLNLQGACRSVIYYSNDFNALNRWQSEDRTYRIGTDGSVTYVDLCANKTVDRLILSNLRKKKDLSSLTLDEIRAALL